MLTIMFPGQGTQYQGMGIHLYDKYNDLFKIASEISGYSIREICEQGGKQLNKTSITQVALFTINSMYYEEAKSIGIQPDFLLGHSLGEFNALYASGVYDFKTGVEIVCKRGEVMERLHSNGGMLAILGINHDVIKDIIKNYTNVFIANFNSATQVTVSGELDQLELFKNQIELSGGNAIPLNVSGAFHCPFMQNASEEFSDFLSNYTFYPPKIKVISNFTAEPYQSDFIKENMVFQMTNPVRWEDSIKGIAKKGLGIFLELGPKNVLTKLNNHILSLS